MQIYSIRSVEADRFFHHYRWNTSIQSACTGGTPL